MTCDQLLRARRGVGRVSPASPRKQSDTRASADGPTSRATEPDRVTAQFAGGAGGDVDEGLTGCSCPSDRWSQ